MRWTAKRKAGIVAAVRAGTVSEQELERRYGISAEELAGWMRAYDASGTRGLQIGKPASEFPTYDHDICEAATRLIHQHGADAGAEAARQARMVERGDGAARRYWTRIRRAIKALQARPTGKPNCNGPSVLYAF
jgi:transposase-like protein